MKIVAKTLYGLEELVAGELSEMGASNIRTANRAVLFDGNLELLYRANYTSRYALSFLVTVKQFTVNSKDDLYNNALAVKWSEFMDNSKLFYINPVVKSSGFNHSAYPALVVKDAIADYFRGRTGERPSVDAKDPDIVINLHISGNRADILLDSTVVPLYKRGYRTEQGQAPLNEVLAASIVKLSGWQPDTPFYDLMCGSGTFSIEAAMIARNIPAGKFRKSFGFERWDNFNPGLFERVKSQADSEINNSMPEICISDISEQAVNDAAINIRNSGFSDILKPQVKDIAGYNDSNREGFLFLNPPYGVRLTTDEMDKLYSGLGSLVKHHFHGSRVWIITAAPGALKHIGLKPRSKRKLFNGALETVLAEYEIFKGSLKDMVIAKSH